MRRIAEEDLSEYKNFISVNANASNTKLQDKSVDFVTAAQAFHWFDRQGFKSECQRILKDGGEIAIIWNTRDYSCHIVRKDLVIREKYAVDRKGLDDGGRLSKDWSDFFIDGVCEYKSSKNDLILDRETYIGMNLTRSYSPREEQYPEKYRGLIKELGELFDEYNINGILDFPHFTQSYTGGI